MKKLISRILTCAGLAIIVGSVGCMEQETLTVAETLLRVMYGSFAIAMAWVLNQICDIVSTVKRCKKHHRKNLTADNIISYRQSA